MLRMVILGAVRKVNRSFCSRERKHPFYSISPHVFVVKVIGKYKVGPWFGDKSSGTSVRCLNPSFRHDSGSKTIISKLAFGLSCSVQ